MRSKELVSLFNNLSQIRRDDDKILMLDEQIQLLKFDLDQEINEVT